MLKLIGSLIALPLAAIVSLPAAHATTFFDLKYQDKSLGELKFSIDASKPSLYFADGAYFQYGSGNLYTFRNGNNEGGFTINQDCCNLTGPQLYSGAESNPTFLLGKFRLFEPVYGAAFVTITGDGVPAVPEPETWALFILGLGVVGYSMRRQKLTYGSAV